MDAARLEQVITEKSGIDVRVRLLDGGFVVTFLNSRSVSPLVARWLQSRLNVTAIANENRLICKF